MLDIEDDLQPLGALLADRGAGRDLFAEERRSSGYDADGVQAHLLRLFGKTGERVGGGRGRTRGGAPNRHEGQLV